jgi:murein DD-endopeptidase MepM/ murein hydrolase activator NlpD
MLGWNALFPPEAQVADAARTETVVTSLPPTTPAVQVVAEAPVVTVPEMKDVKAPTQNPVPVVQQGGTTALSLSDVKSAETSKLSVQYLDHVVADGEDIAGIAASYGLKSQTVIAVNQIRNVNAVRPGVTLRIPDRDGQVYVVKNGDMLSAIARSYNMGWKTLMEVNGLTNEMIRPGQTLFIPDQTQTIAEVAEVATVSFQKPAKGNIIGSFGQVSADPADDGNLDGVLIEGQAGSAVFAAANGDVVDAGYEQKGRGRFVVISHDDGYKTTYAHLENVDVKSGVKVIKGQVIGSMGTSGTNFASPTLYFAIEQNGISLNPADFF